SQGLGRLAGLAELDRLAEGRLDRRARLLAAQSAFLGALRALVADEGDAADAEHERGEDRARQGQRQAPRAPLLRGLDARLGRGELGLLRALLGRREEGVHRLRDLLG